MHVAGLQQLNWDSEGVGSKAAALVDLSTVAGNKISNPPWVKFQSAGWVNFPSAPTDYGYPGHFNQDKQGALLAKRALERHRSDYQQAHGDSDQPLLVSGHFLRLAEHGNPAWNDLWLLTEITHEGRQPQVLEEAIVSDFEADLDGFHQGYRNHFVATPWDTPFRPPLEHPKPRLFGTQSAVVTGPEGEEIYCDAYGRVKVQFFWDREGQADERTSCWMRVASNWASQGFGAISLPRIGMEVLISFQEGDPDRPLVTGCLFHGVHLPPYRLPDFKTVATVKSKEHKGSRSNELRIDDTNQRTDARGYMFRVALRDSLREAERQNTLFTDMLPEEQKLEKHSLYGLNLQVPEGMAK
ncbi:hypothetical protein CS390_06655 [Pseudomonas sp. HLS-6]|nr:hypothetical protein CS390_06655 [Pseudomonas sp. HLS-6]